MKHFNEYNHKRYGCYFTDTGIVCESDSLKQIIKFSRGGFDAYGEVGYIFVLPAGVGEVAMKIIGRVRHGVVVKRF